MRYCVNLVAVFTLLASVASPSIEAQDWTRFRGPNGSGEVENCDLPSTWTDNDYSWKVELPGIGHSSPVVWGNRLFVMSADPQSAERYLLCLDTDSGKKLWQKNFASQPHHLHTRSSYASGTPAVDKDHVYFTYGSPEQVVLAAYDHNGQEIWTRDLGTFLSQHGYGASPMLFDKMVILSNSQQEENVPPGKDAGESSMMAFERMTGKTVWQTPRVSKRVCYSVPCIYHTADGKPELICTNTGNGVYSLDPFTGKENWSVGDAFSMRTVSSPIIAGGHIFGSTGSGGGGNYVVAIKPGETPEEAYRIERQAPYVPTAVARENLVFLFSDKGFVTCIDARTGKAFWKERLNTAFSGSPVRVGDKIYCIDESGDVFVLAASEKFKQLGRVALGEASRATPAVSHGRMFLRTDSHLFCLGSKQL